MAMYSGTTKAEILRFQSAYRLLLGLGSAITQQSFFTGGTERLTISNTGNAPIAAVKVKEIANAETVQTKAKVEEEKRSREIRNKIKS
mgnify:CR=1 FL=1